MVFEFFWHLKKRSYHVRPIMHQRFLLENLSNFRSHHNCTPARSHKKWARVSIFTIAKIYLYNFKYLWSFIFYFKTPILVVIILMKPGFKNLVALGLATKGILCWECQSIFTPGGTQLWVGYGCAARSFEHHPITKPEKTQICYLYQNHSFL